MITASSIQNKETQARENMLLGPGHSVGDIKTVIKEEKWEDRQQREGGRGSEDKDKQGEGAKEE